MVFPKSILKVPSFSSQIRSKAEEDDTWSFSTEVSKIMPPFLRGVPETEPVAEERLDDDVRERVEHDDKIGMSFDHKLADDVSMCVTFDDDCAKKCFPVDPSLDQGLKSVQNCTSCVPSFDEGLRSCSLLPSFDGVEDSPYVPPCTEGLELTLDNFVEYEEIKKKIRHMKLVDEELVSLDELKKTSSTSRDLTEIRRAERELKRIRENLEFKMKEAEEKDRAERESEQKKAGHELRKLESEKREREMVELAALKKKETERRERVKLALAAKELRDIKAALERSKITRVPIQQTVQDRMKQSVAIVDNAARAQAKIDKEFADMLRKSKNPKVRCIAAKCEKLPHENLLVPPAAYYNKVQGEDFALATASTDEEDSQYETADSRAASDQVKAIQTFSRPGYIKKPLGGIEKAWKEVTELVSDLRYTVVEDAPLPVDSGKKAESKTVKKV